MEQGDAARLHAFPGEGGQCRMQPGELLEPLVQHVPQGAHLALGQACQRHQFGGDGEGIDAACLPRIEVGADAAAIIVGVLLEQLVHLFPLDGNEAGLTAAGEIADGLIGVTGDHEGGIQGAVTEPLQPVARGDHGRAAEVGDPPPHGIEQGPAGDPVPGVGGADIDPLALDVGQGGDVAGGAGNQGQGLLVEPQQAAQLIVRGLAREGAGAVHRMVEHIRLHQGELYLSLGEGRQIGDGARGTLHRAVQAVAGTLLVEQAADGPPCGVVDAVEGSRTDGDIGGGGEEGGRQHGRKPGQGGT